MKLKRLQLPIRLIIWLALSLICLTTNGQNIKFSPEIATSSDDAIVSISKYWERYFLSSDSSNIFFDENNQRTDMLRYVFGPKSVFYKDFEHYTFSIRKVNDPLYEICTLARFYPDINSGEIVLMIYKTYASYSNKAIALVNYFDIEKQHLCQYSTSKIDFYYPHGLLLKQDDFEKSDKFVNYLAMKLGISIETRIPYIIGRNIDECWDLIGVPYTVARSEKSYAGYTIFPNVVLSSRPDHIHEIVHAVLLPQYPNALKIMHEGIATYYGGSSNESFAFLLKELKKTLSTRKDIDFSDYSALLNNADNIYKEVPLLNVIGATIVNHVIDKYGEKKLLSLLECEDYTQLFKTLEVDKANISDWIINTINSY